MMCTYYFKISRHSDGQFTSHNSSSSFLLLKFLWWIVVSSCPALFYAAIHMGNHLAYVLISLQPQVFKDPDTVPHSQAKNIQFPRQMQSSEAVMCRPTHGLRPVTLYEERSKASRCKYLHTLWQNNKSYLGEGRTKHGLISMQSRSQEALSTVMLIYAFCPSFDQNPSHVSHIHLLQLIW